MGNLLKSIKTKNKSVAVIDDGVSQNVMQTPVLKYRTCYSKVVPDDTETYGISHGTICAKIIETYGNTDLFYSIRILENGKPGKIEELTCALEWCTHVDVELINLSVGVSHFLECSEEYARLFNVCSVLHSQGKTIVAAQSNRGSITIPASFSFIISVECNGFPHLYWRKSDYRCSGTHLICIKGKKLLTENCNSYACAYICAKTTKKIRVPSILDTRKGLCMKNETMMRKSCLYRFSPFEATCLNIFKWKRKASIEEVFLPTILLRGGRCGIISTSMLLKQRLYKGGYDGVVITDMRGIPLTSSIRVIEISNRILNRIAKIQQADVVIVISNNEKYTTYDYTINCDKGDYKLYYDDNYHVFINNNELVSELMKILT